MAFTKEVSPFLMFDFAAPKHFPPTTKKLGVGQHPHRGFETVTIAFNGEVEHGDSRGNKGIIGEGDVQWMTAGHGIIHEEFHSRKFASKGGLFSMAQLWVNLPRKDKLTKPRYQPILKKQITVAPLGDGKSKARVIAGDCGGVRGPAHTFTPINVWDVILEKNEKVVLPVPENHNTILFVRTGSIRADGKTLKEAQVSLWGTAGSGVPVEATEAGTSLVLLSGVPIDEPIAHRGPFVMNTQAELDQAWGDFHAGRMGNHF